jgi:hypothetical protein
MNETAYGVGGNKAKQPQDDQDNGDGIQHGDYPFVNFEVSPSAAVRSVRQRTYA